MFRKFFTVLLITLVGLFGVGGLSSAAAPELSNAAPGDYPSQGGVTVTITGLNFSVDANGNIIVTGTFTFSGGGFLPGETITFTITINGPSGLRSSAGLSKLGPEAPAATQAQADGSFGIPVTITQPGTYTITATGATSGKSSSLTFTVPDNNSGSGTGSNSGAGVGVGSGSGTGSGTGAGASGDNSAGGLAYTGASIAGPLAIGFVALFAGLALLFFGTRGVRRRRHSQTA